MQTAIVIPVYNEDKRIGNLLQELENFKHPVVVVDDGSKDRTSDIAKRYKVTVVRHKINMGKGAALKTGCDAAFLLGVDAVIVMDGDGQHIANDIPKFLEVLGNGCDVAFGSRNLNLGIPFIRFMGNKFASVLISILFGIYVSDLVCGYRAFTRKAYNRIKWESKGYAVETEMVVKTGESKLRYCEVPVETIYYDKFKGVTIVDAFDVFINVLKWRLIK